MLPQYAQARALATTQDYQNRFHPAFQAEAANRSTADYPASTHVGQRAAISNRARAEEHCATRLEAAVNRILSRKISSHHDFWSSQRH